MNGIYFAYEKGKLILKNVDFELEKGDFVSLIGGNGVGKSTFLQLLVGILKPIKGKVKYKKGIKLAYVHQNPMIHFSKDMNFTVLTYKSRHAYTKGTNESRNKIFDWIRSYSDEFETFEALQEMVERINIKMNT